MLENHISINHLDRNTRDIDNPNQNALTYFYSQTRDKFPQIQLDRTIEDLKNIYLNKTILNITIDEDKFKLLLTRAINRFNKQETELNHDIESNNLDNELQGILSGIFKMELVTNNIRPNLNFQDNNDDIYKSYIGRDYIYEKEAFASHMESDINDTYDLEYLTHIKTRIINVLGNPNNDFHPILYGSLRVLLPFINSLTIGLSIYHGVPQVRRFIGNLDDDVQSNRDNLRVFAGVGLVYGSGLAGYATSRLIVPAIRRIHQSIHNRRVNRNNNPVVNEDERGNIELINMDQTTQQQLTPTVATETAIFIENNHQVDLSLSEVTRFTNNAIDNQLMNSPIAVNHNNNHNTPTHNSQHNPFIRR